MAGAEFVVLRVGVAVVARFLVTSPVLVWLWGQLRAVGGWICWPAAHALTMRENGFSCAFWVVKDSDGR